MAGDRPAQAFSLIELLAVIAILGLLMAAVVPIFSNSSNNARQASREIVKAHLQRARAHAIATGTPTAVAVPVLASGGGLGARALSLFEVGLDSGSYVPTKDADGNDRLLQSWQTLPGNFHFLAGSQIPSGKQTFIDAADTMPTNYKGQALTCHIIVFAPTGQIVRPLTEINIATAQAAARGSALTLTEKTGGEAVIDFLQVNRLTGRTRFLEP